ncbi:uncharacterized protein DUF3793 [Mobilisporobacter senegalensis]|uniref:Uncharacterized protein DUF3793 n=1 Tax=Mobilisporobacter senegalensis TaxID=1329262 RepID=A0A3N1XNJ3_9FIRM|nr:DUF3793 family protein [Mobilisporobacter senegalensis]ROR28249.1 uncharacterized protein DUF3793 [Mobilisporobacter senegalensis]
MLTYHEFEKLLAYYCAPSIMGLKPANLLSCQIEIKMLKKWIHEFHESLSTCPVRIKILYQLRAGNILLIYDASLLEQQLSKPEIKAFLKNYDYPLNHSLDEMIDFLALRIKKSKEYPHEIGVFLGYPLDDIIGFIMNQGKNYKLCGYWKVYSNEKDTIHIFDSYTKSRLYLYDKVSRGITLKEMQSLYFSQTSEPHKSRLE